MSGSKFKYFRDPDNFALRVDKISPCSICETEGLWFEAGGFYGINEIKCICHNCLSEGKLKNLEIETNQASEGTTEEIEAIIYRTPALPTWQDRIWPYVEGQYCVFERIASKEDFESEKEFLNSFSENDKENSDLEWLWKILPDRRIVNHLDGNYDVSVYLFTYGDTKYCKWDAS